jgi:hypothetical protein
MLGEEGKDGCRDVVQTWGCEVVAVTLRGYGRVDLGRHCVNCQTWQALKDSRPRSFRTVFGVVKVFSCRYLRCGCRGGAGQIVSPLWFLRHRRATPELEYLLASWGSRMPYRRAAELLGELLPIFDRTD